MARSHALPLLSRDTLTDAMTATTYNEIFKDLQDTLRQYFTIETWFFISGHDNLILIKRQIRTMNL